jgi:hypothetical protein
MTVYRFHFNDGVEPGFTFTHIKHQLKITGTVVFYKQLFNNFEAALAGDEDGKK